MRRLFPCSVLARIPFVLAAVPGAAHLAGAAVIHTDLAAAPLVIPSTLPGVYVNFVTGASAAVALSGYDFNPYNNGFGLTFFAPDFPNSQGTLVTGATAQALLGGETIGSSGIYQPSQALGTNFLITGVSFAGLRFWNESTSQLNYGWAKVSTTAGTGFPATLLGYAYEDTGAPIFAGQIPEPGAVGLLVLSGAALLTRKGARGSRP